MKSDTVLRISKRHSRSIFDARRHTRLYHYHTFLSSRDLCEKQTTARGAKIISSKSSCPPDEIGQNPHESDSNPDVIDFEKMNHYCSKIGAIAVSVDRCVAQSLHFHREQQQQHQQLSGIMEGGGAMLEDMEGEEMEDQQLDSAMEGGDMVEDTEKWRSGS